MFSGTIVSGGSKKPDAADIHIGRRVQERRKQIGISQERLGEQLGITFQQVQKYEKGANRIGAGRLFSISEILRTPVGFFYEGLDHADSGSPDGMRDGDGQQPPLDGAFSAETERMAREFERISDPAVRAGIVELVRTLAAQNAVSRTRRER